MSTLTSIKEVLDKLMKDVFVVTPLPEKVTYYGKPQDNYTKVVETYTVDDEGKLHIDRCVQYKESIDFINSIEVDVMKAEEEQG
jgi:hypothetical protein